MRICCTAALIVLAAMAALLGGGRTVLAQEATCVNDAALLDRPALNAPPLVAPQTSFTVTWRLSNTGDCTWGDGYALAPVDAAALGDPSAPLTTTLAPGEVLTVTLTLTAPAAPGYHQGVWRLADAATSFGPWLPVEIEVAGDAANPDAAVGDVELPEVLAMSGFGLVAPFDDDYLLRGPLCRDGGRCAHACRRGSVSGVAFPEAPGPSVSGDGGQPRDLYVDRGHRRCVSGNGGRHVCPVCRCRRRRLYAYRRQCAAGVAGRRGAGWLDVGRDLAGRRRDPALRSPAALDAEQLGDGLYAGQPACRHGGPLCRGCGLSLHLCRGRAVLCDGRGFPPSTPVQLGVYVSRFGVEYLDDRIQVITDAQGGFRKLYAAGDPGQEYSIYLLDELNPDAFADDGLSYDPFLPFGDGTTLSVCYTVRAADETVRLAYAVGEPGVAEVAYINPDSQWTQYASQGFGACDSGAPTWAGDGALVYHSNCAGSYDLYRYTDPGTSTVPAAPILTTPDVDETEPSVDGDGRIVFRRAPAGSDPEASGELWLLDPGATEPISLGLVGRAPAWSPDGMRIAYMADTMEDAGGTWQVYVYDLAADETQLVSVDCPGHCRYPAWSPDGTRLVYGATAAVDDLTPAGLWLARVPTGRVDGTARLWQDGPTTSRPGPPRGGSSLPVPTDSIAPDPTIRRPRRRPI